MDQMDTATAAAAAGSLAPTRVKAMLILGGESFAVSGSSSESSSSSSSGASLSEQLAAMKEKSMAILKDYITKHNAPNDVPDEPLDGGDDDEPLAKNPPKKSKKQK